MARGAPQLLRRALSRGKHHVALPRRALSTTSQKAILITSPQGSAFVRVKNSNQGELFSTSNAAASSLNQEQDELRRSESLERVKSVTHATPNNGLLSRAEALRGGLLLGLDEGEVDALFSGHAHGPSATVDEATFLRALVRAKAAKHYSFATPDADFSGPRAAEVARKVAEAEATAAAGRALDVSSSLSFAAPESDFSGARPEELRFSTPYNIGDLDIRHLSWASPEADFTAMRPEELRAAIDGPRDLSYLSWASPESDFAATPLPPQEAEINLDIQHLSWASPEADFTAMRPEELRASSQSSRSSWLDLFLHYPTTLSFASPESDFSGPAHAPHLKSPIWEEHEITAKEVPRRQEQRHREQRQQQQAEEVVEELVAAHNEKIDDEAMAAAMAMQMNMKNVQQQLTLQEALAPSVEARVLTKAAAPFEICHVNGAWSSLCGFSSAEATGQTLGIIQGPETESPALEELLSALTQGSPADVVLTNYKKEGGAFRNHLSVVPVVDEASGELTHFLGTLRDLQDQHAPQSKAYASSSAVDLRM